MPAKRFLRYYLPRPNASRLLICLPHAGGGASAFRAWPHAFGADTEVAVVQYPGREDRFGEPCIDEMDLLLAALAAELAPLISLRSFVLFGHSMGGAVAHELAMRFGAQGTPPQCLVISGRQPPSDHVAGGRTHLGSDDEILAELLRLSPDNRALAQEPELAALLLPVVRSDYRLIETYCPGDPVILDCPVTVLAGEQDPELSRSAAAAWARYTCAACQVRYFPGNHFFIASERDRVIAAVREAIGDRGTP